MQINVQNVNKLMDESYISMVCVENAQKFKQIGAVLHSSLNDQQTSEITCFHCKRNKRYTCDTYSLEMQCSIFYLNDVQDQCISANFVASAYSPDSSGHH